MTVQDLYAAAKQWIDGLVAAEIQDAETSPICDDGLVIPGPHMTRGNTVLFVFLLLWSFIGVAIAADVFMVAPPGFWPGFGNRCGSGQWGDLFDGWFVVGKSCVEHWRVDQNIGPQTDQIDGGPDIQGGCPSA